MSGVSVLTAADVGSANRARLIRQLYRNGAQSRTELATSLGVSRATISTIVQPILEAGLLEEVDAPRDEQTVRVGKPARPLWFSDEKLLGCAYISGDGVHQAILRMDGEIVRERTTPLRPDGDELGVIDACEDFMAGAPLMGVGIAVAGMVDTEQGIVLQSYRAPELTGLAVAPLLHARLGVPVVADHHPRVQAIGDLWFGEGRDKRNFASLFTGEVLGVGLVLDGRIQRGVHGGGGEIGHMVIDAAGDRCVCGRVGCWETLATLPWLRREALRLGMPGADEINCSTLVDRSAQDPRAMDLLRRYARNIAQGIADLELILGPQCYLIHGDVGHGGARIEMLLLEELAHLLPRRRSLPEVTAVPDDDRSTLLGAAGLLLSSLFSLDADQGRRAVALTL